MIGEPYAKQQVKRLSGLNFFPGEPAAVRELVSALQSAKSEAAAKNTIDSLMAEMTDCPKPAEIRRVLASFTVARECQPGEEHENGRCGRCNGTGWVHERRLVHVPCYGPEGRWNDYAGKCSCGTPVR